MRFKKHKSIVGIDLGSYSMKAVEIESSNNEFYLNKAVSIFYPEKILENGEFQNVPLFTELISKLWENEGFNSRNVSISWRIENGFFRVFTLPLLPDKELDEAIRLEISSRYDIDASLISFDYFILDRNNKNQEMKILAAGIPKSTANIIYSTLKEINFHLEVLEPELICQLNVLPPMKENFILLNVGARITTLYMGIDNIVDVIRILRFGGDNVTETISSVLNISFEEAELWKRERFAQEVGEIKALVSDALFDTFNVLLREVNRSTDYFYQVTSSYPTRVILDGGGAYLSGLDDYISRGLSLPVETLNLDKILKKNLDLENLNFYSVAIGSALSGFGYKCPYNFFEGLELGRVVV